MPGSGSAAAKPPGHVGPGRGACFSAASGDGSCFPVGCAVSIKVTFNNGETDLPRAGISPSSGSTSRPHWRIGLGSNPRRQRAAPLPPILSGAASGWAEAPHAQQQNHPHHPKSGQSKPVCHGSSSGCCLGRIVPWPTVRVDAAAPKAGFTPENRVLDPAAGKKPGKTTPFRVISVEKLGKNATFFPRTLCRRRATV